MTHGAASIFPSQGFDALASLKAVHEEKATVLHGVPTMFIESMNHKDYAKYDLKSLRTGIMAGSTCPIEVMKKVREEMGVRDITICYGMSGFLGVGPVFRHVIDVAC
jgi:fatty-acyl-CoA synthase